MEIKNPKNISVIRADSTKNLRQELQNIRDTGNDLAVVLSFIDEQEFTKKSKFDGQLIEQIKDFPIPIITTIKDSAKGFVFEIVMASHLCVASDSAKFKIESVEEVKKQIGIKNIDKLKSIKYLINAEKAFDLGFINKIVPKKEIEKTAIEMAETISTLAPLAIRSCLKAVNQGLEMNLESGLKLETELFAQVFATEDMKEGTQAFLEKRKPDFMGK